MRVRGLATEACLAHLGHRAECVDKDEWKTSGLRAASLQIACCSDSLGAQAIGYYPVADKAAARRPPSLKVVFDPYEAAEGTHAAVVVSEWEEVRTQELERVSALMQEPKALVDGRNPFEPAAPREAGAPGH